MRMASLIVSVLLVVPTFAVDPKELKPGLIATYTEFVDGKPAGTTQRLDPQPAFFLTPGEQGLYSKNADGKLSPPRTGWGRTTWTGYLYVVTPGDYTFAANVQGGNVAVSLSLNGKTFDVLTEAATEKTKLAIGKKTTFEPGIYRFVATFDYSQPILNKEMPWSEDAVSRRFELLWEGPGFRREPIPYFFFGHTQADRDAVKLEEARRLEFGHYLFTERNCASCHRPERDVKTEKEKKAAGELVSGRTIPGPDLTEIGRRVYPGWLDAWLADPAKIRPHTSMPKMFADDEHGTAERYAVVQYLSSLGGPLSSREGREDPAVAKRGERLFTRVGCAACHANKPNDSVRKRTDDDDPLPPYDPIGSILGHGSPTGPQETYALGALGSKTSTARLAEYLLQPHKTNPQGRMPNLNLTNNEARELAQYLTRTKDPSITTMMPDMPKTKPGDLAAAKEIQNLNAFEPREQWREVGKVLMTQKGCVNCHSVNKGSKNDVTSFASLEKVMRKRMDENTKVITSLPAAGCVAEKPDPAKVPVFGFNAAERTALMQWLSTHREPDRPIQLPMASARLTLKRMMCLNCHTRDGEGGIAAELADKMKALETAENADDVRPPSLTHIGHKATHEWLKEVLLNKGRARPWMGLRMPQYGQAHVGHLVEALPLLEGTLSQSLTEQMPWQKTTGLIEAIPKVSFDAALVTAGRTLTGKDGYGCITCHDISGVVGGGTRGPDLALTTKRIRPEWFERWMHNPQRMSPGTKMPQYFLEGKATNALLDADPAKQIDAFKAYFSLGMGLPLPNGLEPPKGVVLVVKDRPELLRTFMPDGAGTRSFAVGYPGHVNIAYDGTQARIAYAWAGNFLDASPVWTNRGGNPAKLLGPKFWTAPAGHPWTVGNNVPDVGERATDPAFGGFNNPNKAFTGTPLLTFDGYTLDSKGYPTFRSTVRESDNRSGPALTVFEKPAPLTSSVATGFARQFTFETAEPHKAWFLISNDADSMKICGPDGQLIPSTPKEKLDVSDYRFVFPQANGGAMVITFPKRPKDSIIALIQSEKKNGKTAMFLRIPKVVKDAEVVMHTWAIAKDDAKLIRELK
jgi:mono/diheme cytochrome c family protein